eukprot:645193-Rhodomonas_salina.2
MSVRHILPYRQLATVRGNGMVVHRTARPYVSTSHTTVPSASPMSGRSTLPYRELALCQYAAYCRTVT